MEKEKLHAWIYIAAILLFFVDAGFALGDTDWVDPKRESNRALLLEVMFLTLPYSAGFLTAVLHDRWRSHLGALAAAWIIPCSFFEFFICGWLIPGGFVSSIFGLGYIAVFLSFHAPVVALAFRSLQGSPGRRWGWFYAAGYCVVPFVLHTLVPSGRYTTAAQGGQPFPPVQSTLAMLTRLDKCALEFAAKQNPRNYPTSLREFGSEKLGCLPDTVANQAYSDGYRFFYKSTSQDGSGRVTGYEARARWKSFWVNGVFELYTNQDAVFRSSDKGDALAMGTTIRSGPYFSFGCWTNFARSSRYGQKQIPLTAEVVIKDCFGYDDGRKVFDDGRYIWKIEMLKNAAGDISGFSARVRPKEWGVTGFRSYLVEMDFCPLAAPNETPSTIPKFTTYGTLEDREATLDDPIVWTWSERPVNTVWVGW